MGKFGYSGEFAGALPYAQATDATNIVTVGTARKTAEVSYNMAAIEAWTGDAWTDLVDINYGSPFLIQFDRIGYGIVYCLLDAETVGDYVRWQVERDGVVIFDCQIGPNKRQDIVAISDDPTFTPTWPFLCQSRFRIRAYKHGTIDAGLTSAGIAEYVYQGVSLS